MMKNSNKPPKTNSATLDFLLSILVSLLIVVFFLIGIAIIELLSADYRNIIQQNIPTEVYTQPYKHV